VDGRVVGFLELDYRKYAPGCSSSPVPFIEGWYVEPEFQRRGIGRALVDAAIARARAAEDLEIASDAEIENADGVAAHCALGFEEVERVVCFRRSLRGIRNPRRRERSTLLKREHERGERLCKRSLAVQARRPSVR
jgi:aminoglycoside 6'-N-acetyltransferase I